MPASASVQLDPEFLGMLRCPVDHQPVVLAPPALVEAINARIGTLRNVAGKALPGPLHGGLMTADRSRLYPVDDQDIPYLLADEAIALDGELASLASA